jgi:hypothetical protein
MNIRIFFSSPGDVKMERETAKRIVDRLQSEIGGGADIQPYFWEHEVMVATKDYQENIPHMDDFDIVVCILWSRLGTPLDPERHPKPGGGGFKSGTEYEEKLTIALRSYITERIPVSPSRIAAKKRRTYDRQPYLGLASFDYDDAPVFFGRTAQTGEIISVFQNQELEAQTNAEIPPKHFALIPGSSNRPSAAASAPASM